LVIQWQQATVWQAMVLVMAITSGGSVMTVAMLLLSKVRLQNFEKRLLASTCLSGILSAWNNSTATGRIFAKFDIWVFFENKSSKFKSHYNINEIMGTLHEDIRTFMTVSLWIILRMRNILDEACRKYQSIFYVQKLFPEYRAVYKITWKNTVHPERPQMTIIRRIFFACWITKSTAPSGPVFPHCQGFAITLRHITLLRGKLWTIVQPDAETSTWQHIVPTKSRH